MNGYWRGSKNSLMLQVRPEVSIFFLTESREARIPCFGAKTKTRTKMMVCSVTMQPPVAPFRKVARVCPGDGAENTQAGGNAEHFPEPIRQQVGRRSRA